MRISTHQFHTTGIDAITKHQEDMLKVQEKLSTGKKVNGPGDDPVAMNQIHTLNQTMNTIDQYARNGQVAKSQLVLEETAIENTVESIQRARELAIQMMNDTYSPTNRQETAAEIRQIIDQVKNMMNYTSSEGESLFAGNNVFDKPFVEDQNPNGAPFQDTTQVPAVNVTTQYFTYIASDRASDGTLNPPLQKLEAGFGARFVQIGFDIDNTLTADDKGDSSRVRITDHGGKVFEIPGGATSLQHLDDGSGNPDANPDNNVLNVLIELERQLSNGERPDGAIADDLDSAINNLSQVRAEIGGRQNRIEAQYESGETFKLSLEERRMELEDTDIVAAISEFTQKQNALQMAQQIFTRVNNLSLFNYLN